MYFVVGKFSQSCLYLKFFSLKKYPKVLKPLFYIKGERLLNLPIILGTKMKILYYNNFPYIILLL